MLTPDGRARVQAFPEHDLQDLAAMKRFVEEVKREAPRATGVVVNLVEFGDVTVESFTQAIVSATLVIALLLFLIWRSGADVLFAMAPLVLSASLTGASMVVMDLPFDFSNVIVIPLLLGIGVDSGIHLVHRFKARIAGDQGLLGTTTARAVFYSALTTTLSFGSLSFSAHNGMSILGRMLTAGMLFTVICNLVVLPALLALRRPPPD
jgi:predicted RND superfamily exporter protein